MCDLVESNSNMMPLILTDETKSGFGLSSRGSTVVLIDLWGLPLPTSEYLRHFSAVIPRCSFLALDRARNGIEVARFLRAGFSGFLRHDDALRLLVPAIIAIAEGRIWASPEIIRIYMNLTSKRTMADRVGIESLTVREHQIMELLRRRYSNKEMASLLNVSESTVKFHVSNVLMKSNVKRRRDLMETETLTVRVTDDREQVARDMARYDLLAIPVVDEQKPPSRLATKLGAIPRTSLTLEASYRRAQLVSAPALRPAASPPSTSSMSAAGRIV